MYMAAALCSLQNFRARTRAKRLALAKVTLSKAMKARRQGRGRRVLP
jgi:hypothetical protein